MGPSEFDLSLTIAAAPDVLTQDGISQSTLSLVTRGPQGTAVGGVPIRLSMSQAAGTLSATTLTTGSDGRASAVYTAPAASPFQAGGPPTQLLIFATPVGSNYAVSQYQTQHVEMLLLTPPVPPPSVDGPTAVVTFTPASPKVGELITFDASGSFAGPGHQIVSYYWNFGDNQPNDETGADASHEYVAPGTYTMILGVTDEIGQISSAIRTITVAP
jgi:PKD repeat protein